MACPIFAEALMGDMTQTDDDEVDDLYAEFGQGKDPAAAVWELAAKAAQKHRLANKPVPVHVQAALDATGQKNIESMNHSMIKRIVDKVLSPTRAGVHAATPAYRNKKALTGEDKKIVEELSSEPEQSWEEE